MTINSVVSEVTAQRCRVHRISTRRKGLPGTVPNANPTMHDDQVEGNGQSSRAAGGNKLEEHEVVEATRCWSPTVYYSIHTGAQK